MPNLLLFLIAKINSFWGFEKVDVLCSIHVCQEVQRTICCDQITAKTVLHALKKDIYENNDGCINGSHYSV